MHNQDKLTIHHNLENEAKEWEENNGYLLESASLWKAVKYARSQTSIGYNLSDLARNFINASFIKNQADFVDTCRLKDICRGCNTFYRSENLLICLECESERCGGCASVYKRNEYNDPVCLCGGILV